MTEREKAACLETVFASLSPEERGAILERAVGRVRALGKGEKHFAYSMLVRLQRDHLITQERPGSLPMELRRLAPPTRDRHEPLAAEREGEGET